MRISIFLLFVFILLSCKEDEMVDPLPPGLLERLSSIEGLTVRQIATTDHFTRLYEIGFEQPVDHLNPEGPSFTQRIFLGHVHEKLPVVFETEGYERDGHKTRELSSLLESNQIAVEHRFFGSSFHYPKDWQYLTIWQAAQDHHRIVEAFKEIYSADWISSGASKGGNTALFHRRFFPDDVVGTVAYVTPLLLEEEDERFLTFYDTVGTAGCRDSMKNFQRQILEKLDSMPAIFDQYVQFVNSAYGFNFQFSIDYDQIIYESVREDYAFEFWSSEIEDCSTIPGENASAQELFDHFAGVFNVFLFFSNYGVEFWTPWYYQAKTELGNYAYDASHLEDLQINYPELVNFGIPVEFDPSAMQDIQNWILEEGENLIFIYGKKDPWTVAAVEVPDRDDILVFVHPETKHGTRITDFPAIDQDQIFQVIESWME